MAYTPVFYKPQDPTTAPGYDPIKARRQRDLEAEREKNLAEMGRTRRAFQRGIHQTGAMLGGGLAAGGAALGMEPVKEYGLDIYESQMERASAYPGMELGEVVEDGPMMVVPRFAQWGWEKTVENIPFLVGAAVSGGVGAAASGGARIAGSRMLGGLAQGYVNKQAARAVGKTVAEQASKAAAKQASGATLNAAEKAALQAFTRAQDVGLKSLGARAGVVASTSPLESGAMYGEGIERGFDNPYSAIALGTVSGFVETLGGNIRIFDKILGREQAGFMARAVSRARQAIGSGNKPSVRDMNILSRVVRNAAQQGREEFAQETMQELLQLANVAANDPDFEMFTRENLAQLGEAGLAGLSVGMYVGGPSGVMGGRGSVVREKAQALNDEQLSEALQAAREEAAENPGNADMVGLAAILEQEASVRDAQPKSWLGQMAQEVDNAITPLEEVQDLAELDALAEEEAEQKRIEDFQRNEEEQKRLYREKRERERAVRTGMPEVLAMEQELQEEAAGPIDVANMSQTEVLDHLYNLTDDETGAYIAGMTDAERRAALGGFDGYTMKDAPQSSPEGVAGEKPAAMSRRKQVATLVDELGWPKNVVIRMSPETRLVLIGAGKQYSETDDIVSKFGDTEIEDVLSAFPEDVEPTPEMPLVASQDAADATIPVEPTPDIPQGEIEGEVAPAVEEIKEEPVAESSAVPAPTESTAEASATVKETPEAQKQPWEMTKEEFVTNVKPIYFGAGRSTAKSEAIERLKSANKELQRAKEEGKPRVIANAERFLTQAEKVVEDVLRGVYDEASIGTQAHAKAMLQHEKEVKQALSSGKPVPPEVLADYPDLAAKYGKATVDKTATVEPSPGTTVPPKGTADLKTGSIDTKKGSEGRVISQEEADRIAEEELDKIESERLSFEEDVEEGDFTAKDDDDFSFRAVPVGKPAGPGMNKARAEAALKPWADKLAIPIRVHENIDGLPEQARDAANRELERGNIVTAYYDRNAGEIVVVAGNVRSEAELLKAVLPHEVTHYGVEGALGKEGYNKFLDDLVQDKTIGAQIQKLKEEYGWKQDRYAAGEWFAMQAEGKNIEAMPKNLLRRIVFYVRKWLRRAFGAKNVRFTDGEIKDLLRQSYEFATTQPAMDAKAGTSALMGQPLFKTSSMPVLLQQLKEVYAAIEELPPVRSGQPTTGIRARLEAKAQELENRIQSGEVQFRTAKPETPRLDKELKSLEAAIPEQDKDVFKKHRMSTLIRNKIKSIQRGHTLGVRDLREALNEVRGFILNYAREYLPKTGMTRGQVKPLLTAVAQAETADAMLKAYDRVDQIATTTSVKKLRVQIADILKKYTPKKTDRNTISATTLTADEHAKFNMIRHITTLSQERVGAELRRIAEGMVEGNREQLTTAEQDMWTLIETFGNLKSKSESELEAALNQLIAIRDTGRVKRQEKDALRKERIDAIVENVRFIASGGKGKLSQAEEQRRAKEQQEMGLIKRWYTSGKNVVKEWMESNMSLEYILDELSKMERWASPLKGYINETFMPRVNEARSNEGTAIAGNYAEFGEKLREIYGVTDGKALSNIQSQNSVIVDTGIRIEENDQQVPLLLSQNQAAYIWMQWQDPTNAERFAKMGYTPETMRQIEKFMTPQVMAWAEYQIYEWYPKFYQRINAVFREKYNVDLPYNPLYSPRRVVYTEGRDLEHDEMMGANNGLFASILNNHLKMRTENTRPLDITTDADAMLVSHMEQMEHFIAWAEVMQDMRAVFGNGEVRQVIRQYHGTHLLKILDRFMDNMTRGGVDPKVVSKMLDKLRMNFTTGVLAMNLTLTPKQLVSFPAYWAEIPTKAWMRGLADFAANPQQAAKTLMDTKFWKLRYRQGFDRDMMLSMQRNTSQALAGLKNWREILMFPTMLGDKGAILFGGWPVYKYHYDKAIADGKNESEAREIAETEFALSTNRSQQASHPENLPDIMRSGSWARLFTMFQTAPNSYFRIEAAAIRNLYRGRGSKAENLKRLAISHFVLPMLFQFVANGFRWKDDDQLRAAILGSFNGVLIVGGWLEQLVQRITSAITGSKQYFFGVGTNPVFDNANNALKAVERIGRIIDKRSYTAKDISAVMDDLAKTASKVVGVPYEPTARSLEGLYEAATGRPDVTKIIGWSDYAIGRKDARGKILAGYEKYYGTPMDKRDPAELERLRKATADYNKLARERDLQMITGEAIRARSKKAYYKLHGIKR